MIPHFSRTAEAIDMMMSDRSRARCSRSRMAALLEIDGTLRGVHIQLMQTALALRGIGMHELEGGALGLIRYRALEGAKQL